MLRKLAIGSLLLAGCAGLPHSLADRAPINQAVAACRAWRPPPLGPGAFVSAPAVTDASADEPIFAIAEGPADLALNAFQAQSGMRLQATSGDLTAIRTAAISGRMHPRDALVQMLRRSGLDLYDVEAGPDGAPSKVRMLPDTLRVAAAPPCVVEGIGSVEGAVARANRRFGGPAAQVAGVFASIPTRPFDPADRFDFDIPVEAADRGLNDFQVQSGVRVQVIGGDLPALRTGRVKGRLSVEDAIQRLIGPAGLEWISGGGAIGLYDANPCRVRCLGMASDPAP